MRLRDTRLYCAFKKNENPVILRDICWKEGKYEALSAVSIFSHYSAHSVEPTC